MTGKRGSCDRGHGTGERGWEGAGTGEREVGTGERGQQRGWG